MANLDVMDELDALTNPDLVKRAEQESSRSKKRPKFLDIECDIANDELRPYPVTTEYGESTCVNLRLQNIKVNRCVEGEVFTDDEYNLEIRLPKKANSNAEPALMIAAASKVDPSINSIRRLPGLKKVHLVEKVHVWKMREKVQDEFGEDVRDEKGNLTYTDRPINSYYYAIVSVGSKGEKAKVAEPKLVVDDEVKAVALNIIAEEEDGITEKDFNKAAMKNAKLKDFTDALMDGSLITDMVADGAIIRDGDKLRAV